MSRAGNNVRKASTQERDRKAVDLVIAGARWVEIAKDESLGYSSPDHVRISVKRYFDRVAKQQFGHMQPILQERGELMWRKAWQRINQSSTTDEWDRAMRQGFQALTYLARLNGLYDGGPNVHIDVGSGQVSSLRREFRELLEGEDIVDAEVEEEAEDIEHEEEDTDDCPPEAHL